MEPIFLTHARSRRQAMDWALVLASQGIEAIVNDAEAGWELLVPPADYEKALEALEQYRRENQSAGWKPPPIDTGATFHWGGLGWAAAIAAFYYWSAIRFPEARQAGVVDGDQVAAGQWWRLLTAVTLHENPTHLVANATAGTIFLGLAMARFGAGVALLASFAAGVAGNVAGLLIYSRPNQSLGASGMVMGALGLITAQSFSEWRRHPAGGRFIFRAFAAGALILVLLGFDPKSDIVAHMGGFLAGVLAGWALGLIRPERLRRAPVSAGAAVVLAILVLTAWRLALRH
jgi:membrane associated rhomboid family serine protease